MAFIQNFLFQYKCGSLAQKKESLARLTAESIKQNKIRENLNAILTVQDNEKWAVLNGFLSELVNQSASEDVYRNVLASSFSMLADEEGRKFIAAKEIYAKKRNFLYSSSYWISSSWKKVLEYGQVAIVAGSFPMLFILLPVSAFTLLGSMLMNTAGLVGVLGRATEGMSCCYRLLGSLPEDWNVEENNIYLRHSHNNYYDYVYKIKNYIYNENQGRYEPKGEKLVYGQLELSNPEETLSVRNRWLSLSSDNEVIIKSGYRTARNNVIVTKAVEAWFKHMLPFMATALAVQFLLMAVFFPPVYGLVAGVLLAISLAEAKPWFPNRVVSLLPTSTMAATAATVVLLALCLPVSILVPGVILALTVLPIVSTIIGSLAGLCGADAEVNRYQLFSQKNNPARREVGAGLDESISFLCR